MPGIDSFFFFLLFSMKDFFKNRQNIMRLFVLGIGDWGIIGTRTNRLELDKKFRVLPLFKHAHTRLHLSPSALTPTTALASRQQVSVAVSWPHT